MFPPLIASDPRATRTLRARHLLLAHAYLDLQQWWAIIDEMVAIGVARDEELYQATDRLHLDAEKLARKQKSSRRA